ncbi:hypothetical protein [Candidatus Marinarcus aquaticus]|uniref:VCBS repeat-containing protein n=1 Tax=Candidatus Marinarcus aquaticus TaxID=2044504 RepID=A0A4Q0XV54_9BACT|nr:hypothetical protein [Candidatus Marinarcus aquaticus]RXJ60039.1 hypothetical protein CRV04_03225 [Candidatus Marinarcus aquaticus]
MIIENAQVGLYSQSSFTYEHTSSTSLQLHYGAKNENNNDNNTTSNAFVLDFQQASTTTIRYERVVYNSEDQMSLEDRINKMIIEALLRRLYSEQELEVHPAKKTTNQPVNNFIAAPNPYNTASNPYKAQAAQELKAMVFQTHEEYYQKQSVNFSATVKFQTPTQSFEMSIDLSFSQELYESRSTQMVIGDQSFIDPLIINFDEEINPFDNLSSTRFAFDLDNDGSTEMVPYLKHGAGFLAWDKNSNEKIDNGSELFGPQTNNGFKELAQFDRDHNNFIDENDAIFDKLKIWSIDEQGNNSLISLVDANVGAIYLGEAQSGFTYQKGFEDIQAVQKSNGFFIKEDGSGLGVINSIDVVV